MKTALYIISLSLFCIACNVHSKEAKMNTGTVAQIDTLPASCPYLTKDAKGNIVLSWVRSMNDTDAVICYAVSVDEGKTFGAPIVISSSNNVHPHAENMPKVIFKPSGEIIALWGAGNPNPNNKYSGLVYYAQSFDGGKNWSAAQQLVKDTAGYDQRYFDVALLANGEAAITWLDNRKTGKSEGSALFFAQTKGNKGFQNEKLIDQSCCQCCRTDLFVDRKDGIHVLYRSIINDTIRDMVHTISVDGGNTFSPAQRISKDDWVIKACPHTGPSMTENKEGMQFTWYTGAKDQGVLYTQSKNRGKNFSGADSVHAAARHPQITALGNNNLVIVWDESGKVNNQSVNRIGLQQRDADGKILGKSFVTNDTLNATYPVLAPVNGSQVLVAYCKKKGGKNYVAYQNVGL